MLGANVVSLHIAPRGAAPMQSVDHITISRRGVAGDRYFEGSGTYSNHPGSGRALTLIESEALEELRRDYEITLDAGASRRNIVTRGVALNHLVGKEFKIGAALLRGTRLCEPCMHLEQLTGKGVMRGLIHRGGLRAEVVIGAVISCGDPITSISR